MNSLSWIRGINATVGRLAPNRVAGQMRQAFMTPRNLPPRAWELPVLARAERINLRFGLSALRWGHGPTVLLMHGWEGRPTQFARLIEALVAAIDRISLERQTPATMSVWRAALEAVHGPEQQRLF